MREPTDRRSVVGYVSKRGRVHLADILLSQVLCGLPVEADWPHVELPAEEHEVCSRCAAILRSRSYRVRREVALAFVARKRRAGGAR